MKLEWEENPPKEPMTWEQANAYAKELGKGWRLPTIEELVRASDDNVQGFKPNAYWSSSEYDQNTIFACFVYFYSGRRIYFSKTSNLYVRCVREVA